MNIIIHFVIALWESPPKGILHFPATAIDHKADKKKRRTGIPSSESFLFSFSTWMACVCQMWLMAIPSSGVPSFYSRIIRMAARWLAYSNSLRQGSFICAALQPDCHAGGTVSIPSFLRQHMIPGGYGLILCQFPQTGIPHFYGCWTRNRNTGNWCQFPQTGIPHFYGILSEPAKIKGFGAYFRR